MVSCFSVRGEKGGMKNIVDPPVVRQFQSIGYGRDDLNDGKGSIMLQV
jgi:hypothetical protein